MAQATEYVFICIDRLRDDERVDKDRELSYHPYPRGYPSYSLHSLSNQNGGADLPCVAKEERLDLLCRVETPQDLIDVRVYKVFRIVLGLVKAADFPVNCLTQRNLVQFLVRLHLIGCGMDSGELTSGRTL